MGKKPKRCPEKCPKHSFLLKPVHYTANFSRELSACFCPAHLRHPSITPRFNKDRRHYTAGFILPADRKRLTKNDDYYEKDHERYKIEICDEKSSLVMIDQIKFVAKPKSRYQYCNVCKCEYEDYLQHINGPIHRKNINQNRFEGYILEACQNIQAQNLPYHNISFNSLNTQASLPNSSEAFDQKLFLTPTSTSDLTKNQSPTTCKPFQLLLDPTNNVPEQDLVISPFKRFSEATSGPRLTTIKPIILNAPPLSYLNF